MNDRNQDYSEERMNAFVDGELDARERDEILAALAGDPVMGRRLCALRATKDLMRHAYDRAFLPAPRARRARRVSGWGAVAATVAALAIGIVVGVQGHRSLTADARLAWASGLFVTEPGRILIHLDHADPIHMEAALELVDVYLTKARGAHAEVVVNSHGLDLLRGDRTPYASRIVALRARHPNLSFIACEQTIARFRGAGEEVNLMPEAVTTHNSIVHIAERMQQGWVYVKV